MKKRLTSIMGIDLKNSWIPLGCLVAVMLATILSGQVFAASNGAGQYIGEAKAQSIALEHAGISAQQATFVKTHLDSDRGGVVYDVEFFSGNAEYDYEIDAVNGTVREYDREIEYYPAATDSSVPPGATGQYIGEAKAKSVALSDAKLSESQAQRMRVKLDRERGKMVYETKFRNGRTEYEYEIDAISGAIMKSDMEYDD